MRIERRDHERRIPLEAIPLAFRRGRTNVARLVRFEIAALHISVLRFRVDDRRIGRIDLCVEAVAAAGLDPFRIRYAARVHRRARTAPGVVVLQPPADVIRPRHVDADFVELSERNGVDEIPRLAAIAADVDAAVAARDHVIRIARIDPGGVIVAMDPLNQIRSERLAAVFRVVHLRAVNPQALIVVRIDADLAVVAAARIGVGHLRPGLAFVIAAVDAALRVLDERVDHVRISPIKSEADAADFPD